MACSELPGRIVADEAELLDGGRDAFHRGGGDLVRMVQHIRDGPDGDGCGESDISNTDDHGVFLPAGPRNLSLKRTIDRPMT